MSPEKRKKYCQIVKPGTILGWFRHLAARKYNSSKAKVGRPRKKKDIRKLAIEMALAKILGLLGADAREERRRTDEIGEEHRHCHRRHDIPLAQDHHTMSRRDST